VDCLAWGVLSGRYCTACYIFRRTYPGQGQCAGCVRMIAIRKGYCRLCWNQARADARDARATGRRHGRAKAVYFLSGVGADHQLFFAEMVITRGARTTPSPKHSRRGRPATPPPAPAGRPRHHWVQLRLFDDVRPDHTRCNEEAHADAGNPWLAWAHYLAYRRGEARGWRPKVHAEVRRALVIVLAGFADGDVVRCSELVPAMRALRIRADRVAEVLDEMGVLVDDQRPSFEDWLERKLDGLAEGIGQPVEAWVRTLRDGGPRSTARHPDTATAHMNNVRPVLLAWSTRYDHLREVTRDDVLAVLDDLHGSRRSNVLVSLRSLFAFCTKQGTIFRNPTRGIKVGQQVYSVVQPSAKTTSTRQSRSPRPQPIGWSWSSQPSTPPAPRQSASCASRTSTSATGDSPSPAASARSTSSPIGSCWNGSTTGAPAGLAPRTRTCSSTSNRRRRPVRSARSSLPSNSSAAKPRPSTACASIASSRRLSPGDQTRCTWPPCSASTPRPPSATPRPPGSSSRQQPRNKTLQVPTNPRVGPAYRT
jgi:hypothetical protein